MSELTYFLLKVLFLALMWAFVFGVVFAIRTDLFGPRVRVLAHSERRRRKRGQNNSAADADAESSPAPIIAAPIATATAPTTTVPAAGTPVLLPDFPPKPILAAPAATDGYATDASARHLSIIEGPRAGHDFALGTDPITIGRSLESSLVLRDDYTSTNHARIFLRNGTWMIEDQGSTNGTLVDGKRITIPTAIPFDTPISIGTSVLELRR